MQENLNKGLNIDLFETFEGKDKNKQKWGNWFVPEMEGGKQKPDILFVP